MKYYVRILLVFMVILSSNHALNIAKKYPSYAYVFSEFDVDKSYIHNENFRQFVLKNERALKKFYTRSLKRGQEVLPTMKGILVGEGVSDLFLYLSMIESGFSSDALSSKKAVGLWQFMPATAKHYNLTVCSGYDERCDPASSTTAAITYLNKLHRQFGKWYLAAMAYNCGEGCVKNAIKKAGSNDLAVLTDDTLKYLPHETREYIKKILLIAMIGEKNSLGFSNIDYGSMSNGLTKVSVSSGTKLKKVAKAIKMKYKSLKKLNKNLKNGIVPKTKSGKYKITIPLDRIFSFYLRYELTNETVTTKSHLISHYVSLGETLKSIAKKYHTSSEEIMLANQLDDEFLMLNQLLVIPVTENVFESTVLKKGHLK